MIGNVWEWTRSEQDGERVLRGSSWLKAEKVETYRVAFRHTDTGDISDFAYGFRVVVVK
jgi:formylglycine-generating enzyme required for sulfatase activity